MPSLNFKGKALVQNFHLLVPYHELKLVKSKSLTPKVSLHDNLVVHGDSLKALKSLLPYYAGKVKCIYIDPPYNTGNENWVYNDNVSSPMIQEWLGKVVDREDLTRHDKWLCMMMPRLKLLREFLTDDGVIAASCDDNEGHRLHSVMDEIFGEECFLGQIVWKTRNTDNRLKSNISEDHEYVLLYGRSDRAIARGRKIERSDFQNPDKDPRGPYVTDPLTGKATAKDRPNLHYHMRNPDTGDVYKPDSSRGWITDEPGFKELLLDKRIWWPENPLTGNPRKKRFLSETKERMPFSTFWSDLKGQSGADEVDEIMGRRAFAFPKSLEFMTRVLDYLCEEDAIVLDAFAGTGTTAHAALALNKTDSGMRRFILIEGEDFADTLTAERLRRVIKGIPRGKDEVLQKGLGGSFSFAEVGHPMQLEALLKAEKLPSYENLASYVFYTATGEDFDAKRINRKTSFIGESA
jgi:adenine specific DNA methylase Mod